MWAVIHIIVTHVIGWVWLVGMMQSFVLDCPDKLRSLAPVWLSLPPSPSAAAPGHLIMPAPGQYITMDTSPRICHHGYVTMDTSPCSIVCDVADVNEYGLLQHAGDTRACDMEYKLPRLASPQS